MSLMEGQLLPILRQKILDSLAQPIPTITRRDLRIPAIPGKAIAVTGMRRTGKTTFLWQVLSDRVAAGLPREAALLFDFDDERLAGMGADGLTALVEQYYELHPQWRDSRRVTLLFDEIQLVPGWERFARRLLDSEKVELFLSGSSARMLSREIASSMRGRAMEARMFPFSFRESLRHQGREPASADRLPKAGLSSLRKALRDYLVLGGFPEAQGAQTLDRLDLLRGYVDATLLRDVIERYAVSHPLVLRHLTRQLLGNAAGQFSVNRYYNQLKSQGIPVSKDTLHAYLAYLEDAFLVHGVWLAADSERRRMSNPRKFYPADPGLIPIFERSGRPQPGKALETVVLVELLRRGCEVTYVRSAEGFEVDFLTRRPEGMQELVQVCAELDDPATREREVRALLAAAKEHPRARQVLITLTPDSARDVPPSIRVHDASRWLLINR
jgi:predicted AAA+ superfamily ATPase